MNQYQEGSILLTIRLQIYINKLQWTVRWHCNLKSKITWGDLIEWNLKAVGYFLPYCIHFCRIFKAFYLLQSCFIVLNTFNKSLTMIKESHEWIIHVVLVIHIYKTRSMVSWITVERGTTTSTIKLAGSLTTACGKLFT